jgi:hypothetical protein
VHHSSNRVAAAGGKVVRRLRLLNSLFNRRDKRHPTSRINELSARPYRVDGIQKFASSIRFYHIARPPRVEGFFDYISGGLLTEKDYLGFRAELANSPSRLNSI